MRLRNKVLVSLMILALAVTGCTTGTAQPLGVPPADDGDAVPVIPGARVGEDDTSRTVTSDDPPPTPTPPLKGEVVEGEAAVDSINVNIMESFPVQVMVVVRGDLSDGCTSISRSEQSDAGGNTILVRLYTARPAEAMCTEAIVPFEENIPLDVLGLPAGEYTVDVNGQTATFRLEIDNSAPDM